MDDDARLTSAGRLTSPSTGWRDVAVAVAIAVAIAVRCGCRCLCLCPCLLSLTVSVAGRSSVSWRPSIRLRLGRRRRRASSRRTKSATRTAEAAPDESSQLAPPARGSDDVDVERGHHERTRGRRYTARRRTRTTQSASGGARWACFQLVSSRGATTERMDERREMHTPPSHADDGQ